MKGLSTVIVLSATACAAALLDFPVPPVVTDVQKQAMQNLSSRAKVLSQAATPKVLALFDEPDFRDGLKECCHAVAQLSSQELLDRFRAEVRVAELAHAFPVSAGDSFAQDITVSLAEKYSWFLSEWQAPIVSGQNVSNITNMYSLAEVGVFGLKPFVGKIPTWKEAGERLIYIAHNMHQMDTGSLPQFGQVSAVFSTAYVKEMIAIAPMDTGMFEMSCGAGRKILHGLKLDCDAWDLSVGTYEHFDHVIIPNLKVFTKVANTTTVQEAIKLFKRSAFTGNYSKVSSATLQDSMRYYESNILGNPRFPDGVKFLVGNLPEIFGTQKMLDLQKLANRYSWPLAWALGSAGVSAQQEPVFQGNQRILDPSVDATAKLNATLSSSANATFWQVFDEVAKRRKNILPISSSQWTKWWAQLAGDQVQLAPLSASACSDPDPCIGTDVSTGDCVCKGSGMASMEFMV